MLLRELPAVDKNDLIDKAVMWASQNVDKFGNVNKYSLSGWIEDQRLHGLLKLLGRGR
jgi:hypothetical protein